jgi:hypothetical protein
MTGWQTAADGGTVWPVDDYADVIQLSLVV